MIVPPNLFINFGPSDTAGQAVTPYSQFTLTGILVQPVDTTNFAPAALVSEITYTVKVNGTTIGTISTSGNGLQLTLFTTPIVVNRQSIAVIPSGAAGTGLMVTVTPFGLWAQ